MAGKIVLYSAFGNPCKDHRRQNHRTSGPPEVRLTNSPCVKCAEVLYILYMSIDLRAVPIPS
jgi:hypothetical protein